MADLGNQKIKDTYQLVLQTDASGNLQKLDGNSPNPFIINQNLRYLDGATHPSGYVLTSDGSGNASWGAVAFSGDVYISGGSIEGTTIQLQASSGGTVSIPGLSWSSSTSGHISNSGLTGNVGIGTGTPNEKLTVVGDISGTTDLHIGANIYSGTTNLLNIFSNNSGTVTNVSGTAPVVSSGGNTPAISVTTAAVANGSDNLSTGDQIYDFVAGFTAPSASRIVVTDNEVENGPYEITFVQQPSLSAPVFSSSRLFYTPSERNLTSGTFTGALVGNAATATKIASIDNTDIVVLGGAQTLTGTKTLNSFKGTGSVTVTDIKDTDNFSDASATSLATSESIKAYVDSREDADYWTGNTDGSISTSGVTNVKISGNTQMAGTLNVGSTIVSDNEQFFSTTGRLVTADNTSNYFGPNNQGTNYYYWNRDLGTSSTVITNKTQTLNSGFKLPYKAVLTGYHLNIQGRSTADDISFTLVYCDGMWDGDVTSTSQTLVEAEGAQTVTITTANNFYVLDRRDQFSISVDAMTMIYPRFKKTQATGGTNYDFQLAIQYRIVN